MEDVAFVPVTLFGPKGEAVAKWLRKGSQIAIEGRLTTETWQDKATGEKRSKLNVIAESFYFVGRQDAQEAPSPAKERPAPAGVEQHQDYRTPVLHKPAGVEQCSDDDVPF